MYKLQVKNFQSIRDISLELSGFTAITGKSNLGKSSILRALSTVLFNDWHKSYQREGTLNTKISFGKDSDYTIDVLKSDVDNSYMLTHKDSEPLSFNKVGKVVPDEVKNLGFNLFSVDGDDYNLNITYQLDPLFIIAFNDASNTRILNKLFNVSRLERASKLCQKDLKDVKSNLNRLKIEYNEKKLGLKVKEEHYTELIEKVDKLRILRDSILLIESYEGLAYDTEIKVSDLKMKGAFISSVSLNITNCEKVIQINTFLGVKNSIEVKNIKISSVNKVITILDKLVLLKAYFTYISLGNKLKSSLSSALELLEFRDKIGKFECLLRYLSLVDSVNQSSERLQGLSYQITKCVNFINLESVVRLLDTFDNIGGVQSTLRDVSEEVSKYVNFIKLEPVVLYLRLSDKMTNVESCILGLSEEINTLSDQIDSFQSQIKICPTCNQVIK